MENRLPQAPSQSRSEDQRNIKGLFSNLSVEDEADVMMMDKDFAGTESSASATGSSSRTEPASRYASQLEVEVDSENSLLEQSREGFRQMIEEKSEGAV